MWKILLTLGTILSLCTLAGCEAERPEKLSSLQDLSRPYTGVYECTRLLLSGEDLTESYDVKLELSYGGEFTMSYRSSGGRSDEWKGTYTVDTAREEVTMSVGKGQRSVSRTYPMQDGAILIDEVFLGGNLFAEFRPE